MNQGIDVFRRGVGRNRMFFRVAIGVMLCVPVFGLLWGLTDGQFTGSRRMARMTVMSVIGVIAGLGFFAATFRRHKGRDALSRPGDIVSYRTVEVDGEVLVIWITMKDGTSHERPLGTKGRGDEAIAALTALAPHVTREET